MSKTEWAVDGPEGTAVELNGRRFGAGDTGAPMMCSLYCSEMGRHAHIDYCCSASSGHRGETQHISTPLRPHPDKPKDWISHGLYWQRAGFKDPYSRNEQNDFAKCDAMCADPDHGGSVNSPAQPSYCTLPIFHPPFTAAEIVGLGYLSHDGHIFSCKNPALMQQAFHIIFVVDRSSSMGRKDRKPLPNTPGTGLIARINDNRLGAVYSSLNAFWTSREAALNGQGARRDAYSVIMFSDTASTCINNDFASSPSQLLTVVASQRTGHGTNFDAALVAAEALMESNWSTERTPIIIFLSDGECRVDEEAVRNICRSAVALGKPLSLQTIAFGPYNGRLRRMAEIALEVQNTAPQDPLLPAAATLDSSYSEALDSVRLAETFLGIAESLRKPRGSLIR